MYADSKQTDGGSIVFGDPSTGELFEIDFRMLMAVIANRTPCIMSSIESASKICRHGTRQCACRFHYP